MSKIGKWFLYGGKIPRKTKKKILGNRKSRSVIRRMLKETVVGSPIRTMYEQVEFTPHGEFCPKCGESNYVGMGSAASYPEHWESFKCIRCRNVVGYIDIDLEVPPVYIPDIVSLIKKNKADIVIGNRVYRTSMGSIVREVLSVGYRNLADWLIGTGGADTESGYKFFNRKKFLPILATIKDQRWFWDTESIVRSRRAGLVVTEVPVLFLRRFDKVSSVHIIRDTIEYIGNIWRFRKELIMHNE